MEKNNLTPILVVIVVLAVIAGVYYLATHKSAPTIVEYPTTVNNTTNTSTPPANSTQPSRQPSSPIVSTLGANFVSQSTAVLNGNVNPNGVQTSYWYEYGLSSFLGSSTNAQLIGGGYITYSAPGIVSGLRASTTYYFRIGAQNQYGKVYGQILSFNTTNTPPPAYVPPTAETKNATLITQNSATLNGVVNPKGVAGFFWFEYGENLSLGNTTAYSSAGSSNSNVAVQSSISGLSPGTVYYYRFNAQNGYGTVNGNILSFRTDSSTPPPVSKGSEPLASTGSATGISQAGATLHGEVNPNGSQTSYYFEYGKSTLFGLFNLDQKTGSKSAGAGSGPVSVSASLTGLDSGSTYYYRLVAKNQYGTDEGSVHSFVTSQ